MKLMRLIFAFLLLGSLAFAGPQTTSTTTAEDIVSQVRVYLDEPTAVMWDNQDLLRLVNDGMVDISVKAKCYQARETISLTANTIEYTPTSDYIGIIAVHLNQATGGTIKLTPGTVSSVGAIPVSGTTARPSYWYEFGGKIGVYPAYTAVTTQTVTVFMARRPADIGYYSDVRTPAVFDRALVYYVVAQALMIDDRFTAANNYMTMYLGEIDRYRKDFVGVDNETPDPAR